MSAALITLATLSVSPPMYTTPTLASTDSVDTPQEKR